MTITKQALLRALKDTYAALVSEYIAAGGDEEAATNPLLQKRRKLLARTEKFIRKAEDEIAR